MKRRSRIEKRSIDTVKTVEEQEQGRDQRLRRLCEGE